MRALPRTSLPFAQRIVLAGLLLCLALAQSLSLAHRALHPDVRMLAYAHEEQHATHAHGQDCDHGIFSRLFASHEEGDESCRLLDGANGDSDQNSVPALAPPQFSALYWVAIGVRSASFQTTSVFEARAPPALSL